MQTLASAIWSSRLGLSIYYIIAVEEDVDVTNLEDVLWCLTSRLHPINGIHVENRVKGSVCLPFVKTEERKKSIAYRALFDATFPYEWSEEEKPIIVDLEHAWPLKVRKKVLQCVLTILDI